jgi:8-oxo-dGTP diphosphatase
MKHLQVVAAVIFHNGKVLCVQRAKHKFEYLSLKYEFPGGKIEENEEKEEALKREIKEELDLDISIEKEIIEVYYEYPDFAITMYAFKCDSIGSNLQLREHVDYKWLPLDRLDTLDWAGADIPIVQKLVLTID